VYIELPRPVVSPSMGESPTSVVDGRESFFTMAHFAITAL